MIITTLGIDLGKTVCSIAGLDAAGTVVFRRRVRRWRLLKVLSEIPACTVAMEACCGAHHIARACEKMGHQARLMPAHYVKPYVKVRKNDDRDAEAIAEASTRPTMSFVAVKSEAQLDLQAIHRQRERLIGQRTQLINQLRAFLMDRGVLVAKGRRAFEKALSSFLAERRDVVSPSMLALLTDSTEELRLLNERIGRIDQSLAEVAKTDEVVLRLTEIPGIGPLTASALVAAIGDGRAFARGRDLSAWLGLVPRQISTGGKAKLIGISKRGNTYLRKLFIHGARAVLHLVRDRSAPMLEWVDALKKRRHVNVTAVALANKLARIAWAVVANNTRYDRRMAAG